MARERTLTFPNAPEDLIAARIGQGARYELQLKI
jgi:hypothetical protein